MVIFWGIYDKGIAEYMIIFLNIQMYVYVRTNDSSRQAPATL